jgi:hypothetical protein
MYASNPFLYFDTAADDAGFLYRPRRLPHYRISVKSDSAPAHHHKEQQQHHHIVAAHHVGVHHHQYQQHKQHFVAAVVYIARALTIHKSLPLSLLILVYEARKFCCVSAD